MMMTTDNIQTEKKEPNQPKISKKQKKPKKPKKLKKKIVVSIFSIPLGSTFLFYPVIEGDYHPGCIERTKTKVRTKFANAKPKSIKTRIWKKYKAHFVDNEQPFEKLSKRLPPKINKVVIYYPQNIEATEVLAELKKNIDKARKKKRNATIGLGCFLPVAITIDVLTFGFLLATCTAIALGASFVSWRASGTIKKKLEKAVVPPPTGEEQGAATSFSTDPNLTVDDQSPPPPPQSQSQSQFPSPLPERVAVAGVVDDDDETKDVFFVPNESLARFDGRNLQALTDQQINEMAHEIGHPEAAKTFSKLRTKILKDEAKKSKCHCFT